MEILYWWLGDIILVAWRYYTGGVMEIYNTGGLEILYWWLWDIILVAWSYYTGCLEILYWWLGDIVEDNMSVACFE